MTENKSNKLYSFEVLRGLCIIFLMFVHSDIFAGYLFGVKLEPIGPYMGTFMLGCFFFMAGFFAEYSNRKRPKSFISYVWGKFIRLFPPYWMALAAFVFILGFTLKRPVFFVYFFDLQIVFAPTFVKLLLTLWYLSAVFLYYIVFGLVLLRPTRDLLIFALVFFISAYVLNLWRGFFDERFFEYYFIFMAGILMARFDEWREKLFALPMWQLLVVGLICAVLFGVFEFGDYRTRSLGYLFSANLYILSWAIIVLRSFRNPAWHWNLWSFLAYGSFFAYLFHRPIWELMFQFIHFPKLQYGAWYRLMPGSLFVFFISYFMQWGYDLLLNAGGSAWNRLMNKTTPN